MGVTSKVVARIVTVAVVLVAILTARWEITGADFPLTPWRAVGGCGPIVSKDSLVGKWKWVKSCPDTAFTECIMQSSQSYNKYILFSPDSVHTYKNDSLIAAVPLDSAFLRGYKTIRGAGFNNGSMPVSFFNSLYLDTVVMADSTSWVWYYHFYVRDVSGAVRNPIVTANGRHTDGQANACRYYMPNGELVPQGFGPRVHAAVLIQYDPVSGRCERVLKLRANP